jgi:putative hydrolase of the HAD superfamily
VSGAVDLVVFDMDGVLARLDRKRRLELLAEATGRDPTHLRAMLWDSDFEPSAEAGAHPSGDEYLAELNRRIGASLSREQWVRARRDAMSIDRETLGIAEALGRRYPIAMLTNNGSLLLECLPQILPDVHRIFGERAHASFQFGARKPEPEVFERLLARYGVGAGRSVFIDDSDVYVEGARRVGMQAVLYRGARVLRRSLAELGLSPA